MAGGEFTCDSGLCVPMEKRCDQQQDCEDLSDEGGCSLVHVNKLQYLKDKPPPSISPSDKVAVLVSVDVTRILNIMEVGSSFLVVSPGGGGL